MKQTAKNTKQVPKKKTQTVREPRTITPKKARLIGWTIFGLFSFLFLGFYYGDTLKLAEGYSLFVYNYDDLTFINQSSWGIPFYVGRFLLQFYHYPLLGAAISTLILLCTTALFDYGLKSTPKIRFLSFILPTTFFLFLVYLGFGMFHLMEPSLSMVYLAGMFLLSAIFALAMLIVRCVFKSSPTADNAQRVPLKHYLLPSLLWIILATTAVVYPRLGMNIMVHSKMLNGVLEEQWEKVEKIADDLDYHTRSTAAYNAIALAHRGKLAEKLFKVSYRYPLQVTKTAGSPFHETMLYFSLCTYHCGLTHSAYYKAMEYATLNGFSPITLKLLAKCALIQDENELAKKYLHILSKTTFHKDFVRKYMPYTESRELVDSDPEFQRIRDLQPIDPLPFMQYYRDPIFMGYYVDLISGRSLEALHLSLMACLYGKMSNNFMERAQALDRSSILPYHYQEAIYLFSVLKNNPQYADQYNISPQLKQKTLAFLKEYEPLRGDKLKAREILKEKYLGMYAYYFFLENLPEESNKEQEFYKKGVN